MSETKGKLTFRYDLGENHTLATLKVGHPDISSVVLPVEIPEHMKGWMTDRNAVEAWVDTNIDDVKTVLRTLLWLFLDRYPQ